MLVHIAYRHIWDTQREKVNVWRALSARSWTSRDFSQCSFLSVWQVVYYWQCLIIQESSFIKPTYTPPGYNWPRPSKISPSTYLYTLYLPTDSERDPTCPCNALAKPWSPAVIPLALPRSLRDANGERVGSSQIEGWFGELTHMDVLSKALRILVLLGMMMELPKTA